MNNEVDVYENLFEDAPTEDIGKLKEEIEVLNNTIKELKNQIEEFKKINKNLSLQNGTLLNNISSLFLTARREQMRKENVIKELRQEINDIIFRRRRITDNAICNTKKKSEEVELQNLERDFILIQELKSRYEKEDIDEKHSSKHSRESSGDGNVGRHSHKRRDYQRNDHVPRSRLSAHELGDDYRRTYDERQHENKYSSGSCKERLSSNNSSKRPSLKSVIAEKVDHHSSKPYHSRDYRRAYDEKRHDCKYSSSTSKERPSSSNSGKRNVPKSVVGEKVSHETFKPRHSHDQSDNHRSVHDENCKNDKKISSNDITCKKIRNQHPSVDYYNSPMKIIKRSTFKLISPIGATPDHVKDKLNEINVKISPVPMINEFRVLEKNAICIDQIKNEDSNINNASIAVSCDIGEKEHGVFTRKRKRPIRVVISS